MLELEQRNDDDDDEDDCSEDEDDCDEAKYRGIYNLLANFFSREKIKSKTLKTEIINHSQCHNPTEKKELKANLAGYPASSSAATALLCSQIALKLLCTKQHQQLPQQRQQEHQGVNNKRQQQHQQ